MLLSLVTLKSTASVLLVSMSLTIVMTLHLFAGADDVGTRTGKTLSLIRWGGVWLFHELRETAPEGGNGVVFFRHPEDFFELSVQTVGGG